jgi:hypothetical protein
MGANKYKFISRQIIQSAKIKGEMASYCKKSGTGRYFCHRRQRNSRRGRPCQVICEKGVFICNSGEKGDNCRGMESDQMTDGSS